MRALLLALAMLSAGCTSPAQPSDVAKTASSDADRGDASAAPASGGPSSGPGAGATSAPANATRSNVSGSANATANGGPAGPPAPQPIAKGHIVATSPHTNIRSLGVLGVPDLDGFFFPAPPAGSVLTTNTTDGSGLGYDLSMYFHDAAGMYLGGCSTSAKDETCKVPEHAARGEVTGVLGANLDVTVLLLPA